MQEPKKRFIFKEDKTKDMKLKNKKNYEDYQDLGLTGNTPDNENPAFAFNGINSEILAAIASGDIDAAWLAQRELANRGQGINGKWVGFATAKNAIDNRPTNQQWQGEEKKDEIKS